VPSEKTAKVAAPRLLLGRIEPNDKEIIAPSSNLQSNQTTTLLLR
jgi:hypothetical protein